MNFNKNLTSFSCWISIILILLLCAGCSRESGDAKSIGRPADIQPDYSGIVIPPNIAPLNFSINEAGEEYSVQIHSTNGEPIQIQSGSNSIQIPIDQWKNLLTDNPGQELIIDIFIRNQNGEWLSFDPVVNRIAQDSIDGYLSFRKFKPLFNLYEKMGIFQRCIENFDEKPVLLNRLTQDNCMNCHNFWKNGTDRWLLHLRGGPGTSMLLVTDGKVRKINTKTKFNGPFAYPAWHPAGNLIAFSVSDLILFYHERGECRDVLDRYSDIVIYDIPTNTITTSPHISGPNRMEIWPDWSPDGNFLYFCSAPKIENFKDPLKPGNYAHDKIKYDLMRIAFDQGKCELKNLETVVSSSEIGLSITEPRVSPDGRFVLFTAAEYSQFPIYLPSADLYLLDVATGRWKRLEANSDQTDSFHSWSSNSRWIVFSSKRQDGLFTKPYFSHIDSLGNASKPFVLPQEDPSLYETLLEIFNVPEFTKEPVHTSPQDLAKAAFSKQDVLDARLDPDILSNNISDEVNPSENAHASPKQSKNNK